MRIQGTLLTRMAFVGKLLLAAVVLLGLAPSAHAAAGNTALKIYEVAGAGGLAGATYRQDTIILFNPTAATITCTTCAIQSHSGTSNTGAWTVYKLPTLNIPSGGFYMISASSPTLSTSGSLSPIAYDYRLKTLEGTVVDGTSGDNILSSTTGTVALTNTQTALTSVATTTCESGTQLLDMIGYGSDVSPNATAPTPNICYAGNGAAYYDGTSATGRQLGATRKNRCIDTFDNASDFANVALTFLNSSSAPTPCPTGTQLSAVVSATPSNPGATEAVVFRAVVTKATLPSSTGLSVFAHFDSPYYLGAAVQMYDDGTHGDSVAGDGTYTVATSIPAGTLAGFTYPTTVTVNDAQGNQYIGSTPIFIAPGTITMTTPTNTGTVNAGGVLRFPITLTAAHGYGGILNIVCTGTPNTNSLGVPISTQCVTTPPEIIIAANSSTTASLAIATGTTFAAGMGSRSLPFALMGLLCAGLLSVAVWRRKQLPAALLTAVVAFLTLNTTACESNAGLGNTGAAPGVYVYTLTVTDSAVSSITNSLTFTITVK